MKEREREGGGIEELVTRFFFLSPFFSWVYDLKKMILSIISI